MKLHVFFAAALILTCSGCVAYNYADPYPHEYYPYGYNDYPTIYNYYRYSPYYSPYRPFFYPNILLDYRYRSYRDHGVFRGHKNYGHFHGRSHGGGRH